MIKVLLRLFIGLIVVLQTLNAQDSINVYNLSIEELLNIKVVTASKREEKLDDAPNVMYVITRQQIEARGYRNLKDLLVNVPGFNSFHRDLQFVGQVRGIAPNENEKITFMINGQSMNQVTETELLNGPINLDNVERVEIIVGPGSVLYGPESLTSIVNLITRKDGSKNITVGGGSQDKMEGTINLGKKWMNGDYFNFSFTGMQKLGWNAFDSVYHGPKNVGRVNPSYFLYTDCMLDGWALQASSLNSSMPELSIYDKFKGKTAGNRYDYMDKIVMEKDFQLYKKLNSKVTFGYDSKRMLRVQTENIANFSNESYDLSQKSYHAFYSLNHKTEKNYFQSGLQFLYYQNRHNYVFFYLPETPVGDSVSKMNSMVKNRDHVNYGVYFSDEFKLLQNLTITAAIRFDYNTILDNPRWYSSPRFALKYKPVEDYVLKLMYNRAIRMPAPWMSTLNNIWNLEEKENISSGMQSYLKNSLAEKPEILTAYEWQNIFYPIKNSRFSINFYYQELLDYILWYRPFTNAGNFYGYGGEMSFYTQLPYNIAMWGNCSYTETEFKINANDIPTTMAINEDGDMHAVPKIASNFGLDYVYNNFSFSPNVQYFTLQPAKKSPKSEMFYVQNQFYINATVGLHDFYKNFSGFIALKNILDNTEEVSAQAYNRMYHPLGFNFEVMLKYSF